MGAGGTDAGGMGAGGMGAGGVPPPLQQWRQQQPSVMDAGGMGAGGTSSSAEQQIWPGLERLEPPLFSASLDTLVTDNAASVQPLRRRCSSSGASVRSVSGGASSCQLPRSITAITDATRAPAPWSQLAKRKASGNLVVDSPCPQSALAALGKGQKLARTASGSRRLTSADMITPIETPAERHLFFELLTRHKPGAAPINFESMTAEFNVEALRQAENNTVVPVKTEVINMKGTSQLRDFYTRAVTCTRLRNAASSSLTSLACSATAPPAPTVPGGSFGGAAASMPHVAPAAAAAARMPHVAPAVAAAASMPHVAPAVATLNRARLIAKRQLQRLGEQAPLAYNINQQHQQPAGSMESATAPTQFGAVRGPSLLPQLQQQQPAGGMPAALLQALLRSAAMGVTPSLLQLQQQHQPTGGQQAALHQPSMGASINADRVGQFLRQAQQQPPAGMAAPAPAMSQAVTMRGGRGTLKACTQCHWPLKGAADFGLIHGGKDNPCARKGGSVPCAVCNKSLLQHEQPCTRHHEFCVSWDKFE